MFSVKAERHFVLQVIYEGGATNRGQCQDFGALFSPEENKKNIIYVDMTIIGQCNML